MKWINGYYRWFSISFMAIIDILYGISSSFPLLSIFGYTSIISQVDLKGFAGDLRNAMPKKRRRRRQSQLDWRPLGMSDDVGLWDVGRLILERLLGFKRCGFFTGWWFGTSILFSHILGIIIPID